MLTVSLYSGYTLRRVSETDKHGVARAGVGIFAGDKRLSVAADVPLAKRAIDAHTRAGIWKKPNKDGEINE